MMKTTVVSFALLLGLRGVALSAPPTPPIPGGAAQGAAETRAPAGPSVAEATAKADVLLAESEIWIAELEHAVKGGNDGSGCPPNFNLRSYLRDKKEKKISKTIGDEIPAQDNRAKAEWDFYFVCNALATKNTAACAELADQTRDQSNLGDGTSNVTYNTEKDMCGGIYSRMRVKIAAVARDPKFMDVCREMVQQWWPPMKSPASVDAICTAWQASRQGNSDEEDARASEEQSGRAERGTAAEEQEPPALVARVKDIVTAISNGLKSPLKPDQVRNLAYESISNPFWFAGASEEVSKLGHQEVNDYRLALAKKDSKSCKGGLCRMLMTGSAASCEQYAVKVKKQVCARYYRTKFADDRGPLIEERLKLAEALVAGAAGKVVDLREAQAFSERLDRVYSLRDRLTTAIRVLGPLGQKQEGAPVKAGAKKPQ